MVLFTFVHQTIQFLNLLFQQLFLDWSKVKQSAVVTSKELIKLIDMTHIVFLLERDIDNSIGDILSNSVKELRLSNYHLKFWVKVNLVPLIFTLSNF